MNSAIKHRSRSQAATVAFCALSIAFMTVGAWITVPFGPIPFTLQTLAVMFVLFALKPKEALSAIAGYLILGALGLPVFSSFKGGIAAFACPTGGFIVGFFIAAAVALALMAVINGRGVFSSERTRSFFGVKIATGVLARNIVMGVVFLMVLYLFGWAWLMYASGMSAEAALLAAVVPFIPVDAIKMLVAVMLAQMVSNVLK